jgi:hypothetical protein
VAHPASALRGFERPEANSSSWRLALTKASIASILAASERPHERGLANRGIVHVRARHAVRARAAAKAHGPCMYASQPRATALHFAFFSLLLFLLPFSSSLSK